MSRRKVFDLKNPKAWGPEIETLFEFFEHFQYVRAYHCTNLEDPSILKQEGLMVPTKEILLNLAIERYKDVRSVSQIQEQFDTLVIL